MNGLDWERLLRDHGLDPRVPPPRKEQPVQLGTPTSRRWLGWFMIVSACVGLLVGLQKGLDIETSIVVAGFLAVGIWLVQGLDAPTRDSCSLGLYRPGSALVSLPPDASGSTRGLLGLAARGTCSRAPSTAEADGEAWRCWRSRDVFYRR